MWICYFLRTFLQLFCFYRPSAHLRLRLLLRLFSFVFFPCGWSSNVIAFVSALGIVTSLKVVSVSCVTTETDGCTLRKFRCAMGVMALFLPIHLFCCLCFLSVLRYPFLSSFIWACLDAAASLSCLFRWVLSSFIQSSCLNIFLVGTHIPGMLQYFVKSLFLPSDLSSTALS